MTKLWKALGLGTAPAGVNRVSVLTEREMAEGFALAPESKLWGAVLAQLDEKIVEVSDRPLDEKMGNGQMRYHLGGQAALLEFKETLLEREREARERQKV